MDSVRSTFNTRSPDRVADAQLRREDSAQRPRQLGTSCIDEGHQDGGQKGRHRIVEAGLDDDRLHDPTTGLMWPVSSDEQRKGYLDALGIGQWARALIGLRDPLEIVPIAGRAPPQTSFPILETRHRLWCISSWKARSVVPLRAHI
jgi:hypothetical protein